MQVRTRLPHLRGNKVQVGDTHYDVDDQGIISSISDEHGNALLAHAGGAWVEHDPKETGTAPPRKRIKLIGRNVEAPQAEPEGEDEGFPDDPTATGKRGGRRS